MLKLHAEIEIEGIKAHCQKWIADHAGELQKIVADELSRIEPPDIDALVRQTVRRLWETELRQAVELEARVRIRSRIDELMSAATERREG